MNDISSLIMLINGEILELNTVKQNIKNELVSKGIVINSTPYRDYHLAIRGINTVSLTLEFDDLTLFFNKGKRYDDNILSKIDTSNTTIMDSMFKDFTTLQQITLNTDNCYFMGYMFYGCSALVSVNLSSTENVADFAFAFYDTAIQTINLDTVNAQTMEQAFTNCLNLEDITLTSLDTCTNFKGIFYNCKMLYTNGIDISKGEDIRQMYYGCEAITTINVFNPISADSLSGVFQNCISLVNLSQINATNIVDINNAFNGCANLGNIRLINCYNITSANGTFVGCTSLQFLYLEGMSCSFDISNCSLNALSLELLFESLNGIIEPAIVNITGNPGAETCDITIAEHKGWTVIR